MKKRKVVIFAVMALAMSVVGGGVVYKDTHAESEQGDVDFYLNELKTRVDEYLGDTYADYQSDFSTVKLDSGDLPIYYRPEGLESFLFLKNPGKVLEINVGGFDFLYNDHATPAMRQLYYAVNGFFLDELDFSYLYGSGDPFNDYDSEYYKNPNTSNEVLCRFDTTGFDVDGGENSVVRVVCNNAINNYDLDEESKEILNGLMAALRRAGRSENMLSPTVNLDDSIVNSDFEPYQRITVGLRSINYLGGAAGLFYRVSPTSEWVFFTGTQAVLDCSAYDTVDLKRAFVGEVCYDAETGTNSVVALDEPASDGDGEDEGDAPTTPNTGLMLSDIEGMKKIAMVTLPAILIGGFGAKFAINRKNRKVKFNKR